jgi:PAN domain-containing protein
MTDDSRSSAWIQVFGVIGAALIAGAVVIWTQRPVPPTHDNPPPLTETQKAKGPVVMGQLEPGINRQGMDLSADERHTPNAEICAELCRTNSECRAMTYVISLKTCWLKAGVPEPYPPGGPDYVSSRKQ